MTLFSNSHQSPFPFSLLCAIFGMFAFAGYYADILKPLMPDWLAVGIFVLPIMVLVFVQRGEVSDKVLTRTHLTAAALFVILAAGMEAGAYLGYRPKGLTLYRILAHLAWSFSWAGVIKESWGRLKCVAGEPRHTGFDD